MNLSGVRTFFRRPRRLGDCYLQVVILISLAVPTIKITWHLTLSSQGRETDTEPLCALHISALPPSAAVSTEMYFNP
jgi:hypothetical protein